MEWITVIILVISVCRLSCGVVSSLFFNQSHTKLSPMPLTCFGTDFFFSLVTTSLFSLTKIKGERLLASEDNPVIEASSESPLECKSCGTDGSGLGWRPALCPVWVPVLRGWLAQLLVAAPDTFANLLHHIDSIWVISYVCTFKFWLLEAQDPSPVFPL